MRFESVSTDAIEQQLVANQELKSRIDAEQLELLEELDRRQVASGDGYRSLSQWLAARADLRLDTARSLVRTMRRTSDRADLRDALADGTSFDRVESVSKIGCVVGLLEHLDISGVEAEAARRVRTDREGFRSGDDRFLVVQPSLDEGWWKIWGGLEGAAGAVFDKVITDLADEYPDDPDGTRPERGWRKATALYELCLTQHPVPAQVTVFVDAKHAAQTNANSGVVLDAGPAIGRDALEAILCDSVTEVIAGTEDGRYLDFGRKHRTVTPEQKRALHEKFYGMCAIQGCTSRYRLEAHHLTPWTQGGKTDLSELILLCWYHHQITVHHKGFQPYPDPTTGRIQLHKPTNHTNHTQHRPT